MPAEDESVENRRAEAPDGTAGKRQDADAADRSVSPELALIDPVAAEQARRALPDTPLYEDTLLRRVGGERRPPPPRYEDIRRAVAEFGPADEAARQPRRWLLRPAFALVLLLAAIAAAIQEGPRIRSAFSGGGSSGSTAARSAPAGTTTASKALAPSPTVAKTKPAAPSTKTTSKGPTRTTAPAKQPKAKQTTTAKQPAKPTPSRTTAPAKTQPKAKQTTTAPPATSPPPAKTTPKSPARVIPDFVWAPAKGAAGYKIEFRAGKRLVLRRTTKTPRLHVAPAALAPGSYRWRVWAINGQGAAVGGPIVDASVKVG